MRRPDTEANLQAPPAGTRRFLVVANLGSGSTDGDLEREALSRLGHAEVVRLDGSRDLAPAVDRALAEDRIVVAAGGDGTVNAVAQLVAGRGVLGVLPGGTRNHFARGLGVADVDSAYRALAEAPSRRVDVGRVNGRIFVNTVSLGLYPALVRERERVEDRVGRWPGSLAAAIHVLRRARPLVGTIAVDGDARTLAAWVAFVGNNRFDATPGSIGERKRLDEGVLDVRVVTARRRLPAIPAWHALVGRFWQPRGQVRTVARRVEIHLVGASRELAVDGEVVENARHVTAEVVPGGLLVLAPESDR